MTPRQALEFVRKHGVVLEAAGGPVPSLAEAVAGEPLRGGWWSHARGREIFALTRAVRDAPDVLVCRLVEGKISYVHRRLWPALVAAAPRLARKDLARVREVHTASGAHRAQTVPFPRWVPAEVTRAAARLDEAEALELLLRAHRSARGRKAASARRGRRRSSAAT